jgi:hypothetical protein
MSWLQPALLAGLAALAVPVLVHLVQRELRGGRAFPSLMFLERVPFPSRRRRRLRDLLLLALRLLALTALVLAFAGPVLPPRETAAGAAGGGVDTVVLLDTSYSMSSPARWTQALQHARTALREGAASGRVALLTFDRRSRVLAPLADDAASALAALAELRPAAAGTRYAPALDGAGAVLAEGSAGRQVLVLITDLQRSAMVGAARLGSAVALELRRVDAPAGANLSLLHGELLAPAAGGGAAAGVERTFAVNVANTGSEPVVDQWLRLRVNGLAVDADRSLSLAPAEERVVQLPVVLAADGPTRLELSLGDDAIQADNRYHAVLAPHRPVRVAHAVGADDARRSGAGAFLRQSLALAAHPGVSMTALDPRQLVAGGLDAVDVLILEGTAVPEGPAERVVTRFVEDGGGLLVSAGPATAQRWKPAGDALLPGSPRGVLRGAPRGIRAAGGVQEHPLWVLVGAGPAQALAGVRVDAHLDLQPAAQDTVLARLDDGSPLLLERRRGAGRIMVLATTADPRWSTLVLEPGFVALSQAMVVGLAGRHPAAPSVVAHTSVDPLQQLAHLGAQAGRWRRYLLAGGEVLVERPDRGTLAAPGQVFRPQTPGLYTVHPRRGDAPALPVAVNVDPLEARLDGVSEDAFRAWLQRPAAAGVVAPAAAGVDERSERLARMLLALAALLFVAETIGSVYRSRRPAVRGGTQVSSVSEGGQPGVHP